MRVWVKRHNTCLALLLRSLQNTLLHRVSANESVHRDLLGLAQPMSPVHCLLVHGGIPVAVVEDNLGRNKKNDYTVQNVF